MKRPTISNSVVNITELKPAERGRTRREHVYSLSLSLSLYLLTVSPNAFSLSLFRAIVGLFSIF